MKTLKRIILGAVIAMNLMICAKALLPQTPPARPATPYLAPSQPVFLTDLEKSQEENIMLRLQLLQRDQQDFVAGCVRAHGIDISRYRFDAQAKAFFPNAQPPAPAADRPAAPHHSPADKFNKK